MSPPTLPHALTGFLRGLGFESAEYGPTVNGCRSITLRLANPRTANLQSRADFIASPELWAPTGLPAPTRVVATYDTSTGEALIVATWSTP